MVNGKNGSNVVFIISVGVIFLVVGCGIAAPNVFARLTKDIFYFLSVNVGWWYMAAMCFFVIFPLYLAFSRYGTIKLGAADSTPEFSNFAWFGMLFGASMGIGLVFYGVGEPLYHFSSPPFGSQPGSIQAAEDAMRASFFHWGLHPWGAYAVIALCMAYFQFRKGAPALMSSLFYPILGPDAYKTIIGRLVDIFTIFATVAGIATSLGLAVMEINSGFSYLFDAPKNNLSYLLILLFLAVLFIGTALSGINKGIKFLGNLNLVLVCFLFISLLLLGPSLKIIEILFSATGSYLSGFVEQSLNIAPYGGNYKKWLAKWTIFYWAWWIAWAPFVGTFIARISKGRTIREFVVGVLLVPSFTCFCWFSTFGGTALDLQLSGKADMLLAINNDLSTGVFAMYEHIPLGGIMSVLMITVICTFLVTSANSSTFVLAMYSSEGALNPGKMRMLVWGVLQAAFAYVLLMTGEFQSLQTASITAAGPFSFIMVIACFCLFWTLHKDFKGKSTIQ